MLLKIGLALSAAAAVFAVVAAAVVLVWDSSEEPVAYSAETTAEEPLALQRSYRERPKPPVDKVANEREGSSQEALDEREKPPKEGRSQQKPATGGATPLPAGNPGWPAPNRGELERTRTFAPDAGSALTLTIPALGVYDAPVYDSDASSALDAGVAHVPETSMPWDRGAQRNTYLAAHRLGWPGTGSRLLFYELDELRGGDEVILKGRGKTYRYRVTEKLVVDPSDSWVMGQLRDRDMVTLQTCTPVPTFEKRLVIRADRV